MKPSLSVLLSVHNAQAMLQASVQKLLDTLPELTNRFEVLIIDDGSTDATCEVAYELARDYPQVNVTRHATPLGWAAAVAKQAKQAKGEFLMVHCGGEVNGNDMLSLWRLRSRIAPGVEAKAEPKVAAKVDAKGGAKATPKIEDKSGAKAEMKGSAKIEAKASGAEQLPAGKKWRVDGREQPMAGAKPAGAQKPAASTMPAASGAKTQVTSLLDGKCIHAKAGKSNFLLLERGHLNELEHSLAAIPRPNWFESPGMKKVGAASGKNAAGTTRTSGPQGIKPPSFLRQVRNFALGE